MLISRLLRVFFRWLYHPLAFAYDLVAAAVSLGQWKDWGRAVLPFIQGTRILELGHGPGHLLISLASPDRLVIAIDESRQMSRLASRRLKQLAPNEAPALARGISQVLPFPRSSFDTLVSTFPSEYIFDPRTLEEVRRVLVPGGRLVTLPVAWPRNRILSWIFRITGEAPSEALEVVKNRFITPFQKSGFQVDVQTLEVKSGTVMILIATRKED